MANEKGQNSKSKAYLTKKILISCMHELSSPTLSEEENKRVFGKCYRTHGHDYRVEVTVEGEIDELSGLCCDRDSFEDRLRGFQLRFHMSHLNQIFTMTSGEALAKEFFEFLKKEMLPLKVVGVGVQETPKNFFFYGHARLMR